MGIVLLTWLVAASLFGEQQNWRDRFHAPKRWVLSWAQKDPNKILFTTNQSGAFQLYFHDLKSKKLIQLSHESLGQSQGAFSPNGQEILYIKRSTETPMGQIYRVSWKKDKPIERKLIPDFLDTLIGDASWGQGGKNIYFVGSDADGSSIYHYRLKKKAASEIFRGPSGIQKISLSRDEKYLAFLDKKERVSVLDLKTKEITATLSTAKIASENLVVWASVGNPHRLLVTSNEAGLIRPGVFYPEKGLVEWLSLSLNGNIQPVDWLPEGKEILLIQTEQAQTYLWRYNPETKKAVILFLPGGFIHSAMVRPGGELWLNFESSERALGQYAWNQKTTELRQFLPDPADALFQTRSLRGYPVKNIRITSWDGTRIQGWLLKPPGKPEQKRSGIIFLHDNPGVFAGNIWDPLTLALADHGYVVISLNYRRSHGFGKEFEKQIPGNPGIKELEDINSAREYLLREEDVAQEKLIVAGRYYGGYLALMSLTKYPHLWAAGYAFNGIADFSLAYEDASLLGRDWCHRLFGGTPEEKAELYFERSPIAQVDQIRAPVLLVHTEKDALAPKRQMDDFVDNLKALRRKHRYLALSGQERSLSVEDQIKNVEELLKFLSEQGLGPPPQP